MKIGLLYSDNSNAPLAEKVNTAIGLYKTRYNISPTDCHINPIHLENVNTSKINGVKIISDNQIRQHDFWIGSKEYNYDR